MTDDERLQALCRHSHEVWPELWASLWGETAPQTRLAMSVCAGCPVREPCARDGLYEEEGVWGGMSRRSRERLRGALRYEDHPDPKVRAAVQAFLARPTMKNYDAVLVAAGRQPQLRPRDRGKNVA